MGLRILGISSLCFVAIACSGPTNQSPVETKATGTQSMTKESDGSVKVSDEHGTSSIGGGTTVSESDLGVPFYPGSAEISGTGFKFDGPKEVNASCDRSTTDSPDQVIQFYSEKLSNSTKNTSGAISSLTGQLPSGGTVVVAARSKDGQTIISVTARVKK